MSSFIRSEAIATIYVGQATEVATTLAFTPSSKFEVLLLLPCG